MNEEDSQLMPEDAPGEAAQPAGSAGALPDGALIGTAEDDLFAAEDTAAEGPAAAENAEEPTTAQEENAAKPGTTIPAQPAAGEDIPAPAAAQTTTASDDPEPGGADTLQAGENRPPRDFRTEAAEMLSRYPGLRGSALPDAVVQDAVKNGTRLADAYAAYETNTLRTELEALRKENAALRSAADTAARAPVRGVSTGGATDTKAGDPFLAGFDAGY